MKPNEEECAVCHKVMNRYWMEHIGTGRNSHWMHSILPGKSGTKWICPECYKNGHKQVDCVAYRPGRPARREAENK